MNQRKIDRSGSRSSGVAAPRVELSAHGRLRRIALYSGMGLTMLTGGSFALPAQAGAPAFGSPAWIQQRNALPNTVPGSAGGGGTAPSGGVAGAVTTPQQALQRAQNSINDLSRAVLAINSAQAAQNAARMLALSQPNPQGVADGLGANGLQVAAGVPQNLDNPLAGEDPSLWQNARLPTQTQNGSQTTVTVKQTAAKAILTWDSYNVGRNTTLHYDQTAGTLSDGSNQWVALNRVTDASARPSQILGQIKAEGTVLVINRNGIIFGGSAQINTHSLIATSLDYFSTDLAASNSQFLSQGLFPAVASVNPTSVLVSGSLTARGAITIESGAQIETGSGGYSIIAAPTVGNAGTITANDGQALLVAGTDVSFQLPSTASTVDPSRSSNLISAFIPTFGGLLSNSGLIQATRGNVSLIGANVDQDGVVAVTTSVSRPGSVTLRAAAGYNFGSTTTPYYAQPGALNFGSGSTTAILPADDGATAPTSAAANAVFKPGSATLEGGSVTLKSAALIEAPGANITIQAIDAANRSGGAAIVYAGDGVAARIYVDSGATIDVSGLADIQMSVSDTRITIPRIGQNELADSPLLRDSFLFRLQNVVIDSSLSGTRDDGLSWIGSPVLNAAGYIELVPRSISQLLTTAGSLSLTANEVLTRAGSLLNLDGGYVNYLPGRVKGTTKLIGADGRIYDIGYADPNIDYIGIAGSITQVHSRWNISNTYVDPVAGGLLSYYDPGYIAGARAGTLTISGASGGPALALLEGTVSAQAYAGREQVAANAQPAGGSLVLNTGGSPGQAILNANGGNNPFLSGVVIRSGPAQSLDSIVPGFDASTLLQTPEQLAKSQDDTSNLLIWGQVSTDQLSAAGFSSVSITGGAGKGILVTEDAKLQVRPGGSIALNGKGPVTIDGQLLAPAGSITVSSASSDLPIGVTGIPAPGDLVIGATAVLSTRGLFVNDSGLTADQRSGSQYINGGKISLSAAVGSSREIIGYSGNNSSIFGDTSFDTSGSIDLRAGSLIDVSSGGYVDSSGQLVLKNGLPLGKGGSLSLSAGFGLFTYMGGTPNQLPTQAQIHLGGTILSEGFAGGGTLTLRALDIQVGGEPNPAKPYSLLLGTDFFDSQGFGAYDLAAYYDATVAAGATVHISQNSRLPGYTTLTSAATGADLYANGLSRVGTLDPYYRPATNFSLRAGYFLNFSASGGAVNLPRSFYNGFGIWGTTLLDRGASLLGDAGAGITLGSVNQLTVIGSVIARGGSIVLSGDTALISTINPGYAASPIPVNPFYTSPAKSVWLGADSLLDVSGIALLDPLAKPQLLPDGSTYTPRTGRVLDGGSVVISDDSGYVIAQQGARIDVSGTAATLDLPSAGPDAQGRLTQPQSVWSDAGSLTIGAASGLLFDATLSGHGGSAEARGGTLTVTPIPIGLSNTEQGSLILQQSGFMVPEGLTPGAMVEPELAQPSYTLHFAADRLTGSGFDSLVLGANPPLYAATLPTIAFIGDVNLSLARSITLDAQRYLALPADATSLDSAGPGGTVKLSAAYIGLNGYGGTNGSPQALPKPDGGALVLNADQIDIGGRFALQNFASADFTSSGDIRFTTPSQYAYSPVFQNGGVIYVRRVGQLLTAGDLTFTAAQLYPATDEAFALVAAGAVDPATGLPAETTITIRGNGESTAPLSAGGMLLLDASHIIQSGTLRAPSGAIVLGVSDPTDTDTRTLFGNLPLVATQSVELTAGSRTSVSLEGLTVPYGITVDGVQWQYNPQAGQVNPDLTAPPSKNVLVNGVDVAFDKGAVIDLAGGGDLQASEWIPGTGGTRDLLARFNTSFANGTSATQVPLYSDQRKVYAILPGYSGTTAYDPSFDTNLTITGNVPGQDLPGVGQQVYLSGVAGLPAGVYTLLPAQYATLPGAYRVVQDTSAVDSLAINNGVRADGSLVVAGNYVDAFGGSRDARSTRFIVQSRDVWTQYSEYSFTSANSFFPALAASQGRARPLTPQDAGRLAFGASNSLSLDGSLNTAAGTGGIAAQVDIAAQDIQIVGGGATALSGYLQLDATNLSGLGAGSLLIGGTRTQTDDGVTITARANSVVVSNDQNSALTGAEILLVTKTDASGSDANAANGLRIDSGSVIRADGSINAASSVDITIGRDAAGTLAAISGDGALLRVSNGAAVLVQRHGLSSDPAAGGLLDVQAGVTLDGGNALTLDSSGDTRLDPTAVLKAKAIDASSSRISFVGNGSDTDGLGGLVIGAATLAQFANADSLSLRSRSSIDFLGALDLDLGKTASLSAGSFNGDGNAVTIHAKDLTLDNALGAASTPSTVVGSGAFTLDTETLRFGDGHAALSGFGSVSGSATTAVVGSATQTGSSFDFGAVDVSLSAPVFMADAGSDTTLRTSGALTLKAIDGTAPTARPLGGKLAFVGGSLSSDARFLAASGSLSLEATTGDLSLGSTAKLDVAGSSLSFFDVTRYAPGGSINLVADAGNIRSDAGSILDFSAADGGGNAGSLTVKASAGTATLAGTLDGHAAAGSQNGGIGGAFTEDSGGPVDLDALAASLASSGVDHLIAVRSGSGNLVLSAGNTLKADTVALTADGGSGAPTAADGNILIAGTIDASGEKGGDISLYGKSGVDLEGSLIATGSSATERGGTVVIGTAAHYDPANGVNADYGYENVLDGDSGRIVLGSNAGIDVSGGCAGGLCGGTVAFRAPLLVSGDVKVDIAGNAQIKGARDVGLEAYAVWNTTDASSGDHHFDGIIDPAGWYDENGNRVPGHWTDKDGNDLGDSGDPSRDFFTPDDPDANHVGFYGSTLAGFVEKPGFAFEQRFAGRFKDAQGNDVFHARPGVELRNDSPDINGGNISVLSNWNLGAGSSIDNLTYRYKGQAPILTVRAKNDIDVKASITDGFFQIGNPFAPAPQPGTYGDSAAAYSILEGYGLGEPYFYAPTELSAGDAAQIATYYGYYEQYATYLATIINDNIGASPADFYSAQAGGGTTPVSDGPIAPNVPTDPGQYGQYLNSYKNYFNQIVNYYNNSGQTVIPEFALLAPPPPQPIVYLPPVDNSVSPVRSLTNPIPLQSATLMSSPSSSYRFVAGANTASSDPLATIPTTMNVTGNLIVEGHTVLSYTDDISTGLLLDLPLPTMIRTGTGNISIATAGDLRLDDALAPGVIYTAGRQSVDTTLDSSVSLLPTISFNNAFGGAGLLVNGVNTPVAGGDLRIRAGRDIVGNEELFDPDGSITGEAGRYYGQYWSEWTQTSNTNAQTGINFSGFDQGLMSVGGDVAISAGRDIRELSVSLPTTYTITAAADGTQTVTHYGGGDLTVSAGRDILSGAYFVSKGEGSLVADGRIAAGFSLPNLPFGISGSVSTLLGLQDATFNISAAGGVDLGGIYNPDYIRSDFTVAIANGPGTPVSTQSYSTRSAVNVQSLVGDIDYGTLKVPRYVFSYGTRSAGDIDDPSGGFSNNDVYSTAIALPAHLTFDAPNGGISIQHGAELYPAADGQLELVAADDIRLYNDTGSRNFRFGLGDDSEDRYASPLNPLAAGSRFGGSLDVNTDPNLIHQQNPLHAGDIEPVRVYSLDGDIVDGPFYAPGAAYPTLTLVPNKPAQIYAGNDIVDLQFFGQNLDDADVTRIEAGRDLVPGARGTVSIQLGGPGSLFVQAGRNLGPLTTELRGNGIVGTIGNTTSNGFGNPYLPIEGADLVALYGVSPGVDVAGFSARYLDPTAADTSLPRYDAQLIAFVHRYGDAAAQKLTTAEAAYTVFQALPADVQILLVQQVFLDILKQTGLDYNDPASPDFNKYARGYEAINTLFPAALGYTANGLAGGPAGAQNPVVTGNLDIRSSTIQTQAGGNISLLGPGGRALLGSASAPPVIFDSSGRVLVGPNRLGILTLEKGDIDIFSDQSLLLAQSRIFTEQGGDLLIWSSNGDINAGKGAKTSSETPPPAYLCNLDFYCRIDAKGQVSGAGIATLQTIPDAPSGDAVLVAPRGTVDAGDAGIRVSGNLIVAAFAVANADNIEVKGSTVGVPNSRVDSGALAAAGNAAAAATAQANALANRAPPDRGSGLVTVDVIGFGEPDEEQRKRLRKGGL